MAVSRYDKLESPVQLGSDLNQNPVGGDLTLSDVSGGGPENNAYQIKICGSNTQPAEITIDSVLLTPIVAWVEPVYESGLTATTSGFDKFTWTGPYVAGWDAVGEEWVLIGDPIESSILPFPDLDPNALANNSSVSTEYNSYYSGMSSGDRMLPSNINIETDGTYLYLSYTVRKAVTFDGDLRDPRVIVLKYFDGASWVTMYEHTAEVDNTVMQHGNLSHPSLKGYYGTTTLHAHSSDTGRAWIAWSEAGPNAAIPILNTDPSDWLIKLHVKSVQLDGTVDDDLVLIDQIAAKSGGGNWLPHDGPYSGSYAGVNFFRDSLDELYLLTSLVLDGITPSASGCIIYRPSDAYLLELDNTNLQAIGVMGPIAAPDLRAVEDVFVYVATTYTGATDKQKGLAQILLTPGGDPTEITDIDSPLDDIYVTQMRFGAIVFDGANVWCAPTNINYELPLSGLGPSRGWVFNYHFDCRGFGNQEFLEGWSPFNNGGFANGGRVKSPDIAVFGYTSPVDTLYWAGMMKDGGIRVFTFQINRNQLSCGSFEGPVNLDLKYRAAGVTGPNKPTTGATSPVINLDKVKLRASGVTGPNKPATGVSGSPIHLGRISIRAKE